MTDGTIKLVLTLKPHASECADLTIRLAARQRSPDVSRLYDPHWWTKQFLGRSGARDPMPEVLEVIQVPTGASVSFDITGTQLARDIKQVSEVWALAEKTAVEQPAKRGPGRPRKHPLPVPEGDPEC